MPAITFQRLTPAEAPRLAHLTIAPGQEAFVANPVTRLTGSGPMEDGYAILAGEDIVGFLIIDRAYPEAHPFAAAGSLGLRSVLIDAARQGQGLGTAAMRALPALMAQHYPQATQLCLTVNCRNPGAKATYLKSGFIDEGALYHGGRSGPQHILKLALTPSDAA